METRFPKTLQDVQGEWVDWNANAGVQGQKFATPAEYARFMDQREGVDHRKVAYDANFMQKADVFSPMELVATMPMQEPSVDPMTGGAYFEPQPGVPKLNELTESMGRSAGDWIDKWVQPPSPQLEDAVAGTGSLNAQSPVEAPQGDHFSQALAGVGRSFPRAIAQVGAMSLGPVGTVAGLADVASSAYAPERDLIQTAIAPATMLAGMKAIPVSGRLGESVAARAFEPSFQDLVGASSKTYTQDLIPKLFGPNALAENAISAARIGSEGFAGTALGEASRITSELAHGNTDVKLYDPASIGASAAQALMFAPVDVIHRVEPSVARSKSAFDTIAKADAGRDALAKLDSTRGQRIADTHTKLIAAARTGADPTALLEELKSHYIEADARRQPTNEEASRVLMSTADDANSGRMTELDLYGIVKAVQGRFDETVQRDPMTKSPSGAAIAKLVESGLLPKIDNTWMEEQFPQAYKQALGDGPAMRANLVNRIFAHYAEKVPGAIEAYKSRPRSTGMTKTDLDARVEADKDAAYMSGLLKLTPHMQGKKGPDGKTPLDESLLSRDTYLSNATQGSQLDASHVAWGVYDTWKDAIIRLADTYDPVTRTGEFTESRRMSDGTVVEGTPSRMSIEGLVHPSGERSKYKVNFMAKREAGVSVKATSLDRLLENAKERFGNQAEGDIREAPEDFVENRKKLIKTDEELAQEARVNKEGEVEEPPTAPKEDDMGQAPLDQSFDPKDEGQYDAVLLIADKLEKLTNDELWQKYGADKVAGWNAAAPGKRENFQDAMLARIEWDALYDKTVKGRQAITKLSEVQQRFYNQWQANNPGAPKLSDLKSWREVAQAFRHAQRLYWPRMGFDFTELMAKMLDDHPEYQAVLRGRGEKTSQSTAEGQPTSDRPQYFGIVGQTDPIQDVLHLFRGAALRQGKTPEEADAFALTAMKMQAASPENRAVGRLTGDSFSHAHGINQTSKDGPTVGINFDLISQKDAGTASLVEMLKVMGHELTHNYTNIGSSRKNSLLNQQRVEAYEKLAGLFTNIGGQATEEFLNNVIPEVFIPPQYKPNRTVGLGGPNSSFKDEAVSRLMEYMFLGAVTRSNPLQKGVRQGASNWAEATLWLPNEVQAYSRFVFRDMANYLEAFKDVYSKSGRPQDAKTRALLEPLLRFANEFLDGVGEQSVQHEVLGKRLLAGMNASGSVDWPDPIVYHGFTKLDGTELFNLAREGKISMSTPPGEDPYGLSDSQLKMFSPGEDVRPGKLITEGQKRLGARVDSWSKMLGLSYQMMGRYEKAGVDPTIVHYIARKIDDLEPAYWRLTQSIHDPFLSKDEKGNIVYDEKNPVQLILQNKHPESAKGLDAIRRLTLWVNDKGKAAVETGPDGTTRIAEGAQDQVKKELGGLSPEIQQSALEGLRSLSKAYEIEGRMHYDSSVEKVSNTVAKFMMAKDKGMFHDDAFTKAQVAVNTSIGLQQRKNNLERAVQVLKQTQEKMGAQPALGQMASPEIVTAQQEVARAQQDYVQFQEVYKQSNAALSAEQSAVMNNYVNGPAGMVHRLIEMDKMLTGRAGRYYSEARPGRFLVFAKTPEGETYTSSRKTEKEAALLEAQLAKGGYSEIGTRDRTAGDSRGIFDMPDEIVNSFIKIEQSARERFLTTMRGKLSEEDYAFLSQNYNPEGMASSKFLQNKSLDRYLKHQEGVAGRNELNPFEVFNEKSKRVVGTIARRGLRDQVDLALRDPRVRMQGEYREAMQKAVETLMQPVSDNFTMVRAGMNAFFLGLPNVASPAVEATQSLTTVFPALVAKSGFVNAVRQFTGAPLTYYKYSQALQGLEGRRLVEKASEKELVAPKTMTKEESMALYIRRSLDEQRFDYGVVQHDFLTQDFNTLRQYAFGMGLGDVAPKSKGELAKDALYWASQASMGLYTKASGLNNRYAFTAALDALYDKGFRGRELYEEAHLFKNNATFGGGKANEVGYVGQLSNPKTRSWFSLVNTLQRYTLGYTTMLKDLTADVIGKTNLSPMEKSHARQAMTTALVATIGLGGAMSIPGALIGSAVLRALFDIDMKEELRKMWVRLGKGLGADDPMSILFANLAQNGAASQFLGADLTNRFAINSFLGFNAYDGYNTTNLAGPLGGMVQGAINGTKMVAKGDMGQGAMAVLPPSWKPLIDIASQTSEFGDVGMRKANGDLIQPLTTAEKVKYGLGLRPAWMRDYRDAQMAIQTSNKSYEDVKTRRVDAAGSELLRGNNQPAFDWLRDYMKQNPMGNPQDGMKSVIDSALSQSTASDLLAYVPPGNAQAATDIAKSFGDVVHRQSELDLLVKREKLNAQTGYTGGKRITPKAVTRAALIDALVKSKGLTRSQAAELVGKMGY